MSKSCSKKRYSADRVYEYLLQHYPIPRKREECYLVLLDEETLSPRLCLKLARGDQYSLDADVVERAALATIRGRPFVLVHNHPSGSLQASHADAVFTDKFASKVGDLFIDHLVVTDRGYRSVF